MYARRQPFNILLNRLKMNLSLLYYCTFPTILSTVDTLTDWISYESPHLNLFPHLNPFWGSPLLYTLFLLLPFPPALCLFHSLPPDFSLLHLLQNWYALYLWKLKYVNFPSSVAIVWFNISDIHPHSNFFSPSSPPNNISFPKYSYPTL